MPSGGEIVEWAGAVYKFMQVSYQYLVNKKQYFKLRLFDEKELSTERLLRDC